MENIKALRAGALALSEAEEGEVAQSGDESDLGKVTAASNTYEGVTEQFEFLTAVQSGRSST